MKIVILPSPSNTINHILSCINTALIKKGHDVFFPQLTIENKQQKLPTKDFIEIINNKPDLVLFVGMAGIIRHEILDKYDHLLEANKIPYAILFYDFPSNLPTLAKTKLNYLKQIFTWDRAHIEQFKNYEISKVSYLPLATSPEYFNRQPNSGKNYNISFVGGLAGNGQIKEFYSKIPEKSRISADNILEGIIKSNDMKNFFDESINNDNYHDFHLYIDHRYNNYIRKKIITKLSNRYAVHVFGNREWNTINKIMFHRCVDYREIVSKVYSKSKINLNITSAHLTTSLNQRVFDCYGSGNFMISDYRDDIDYLFYQRGYKVPYYKNTNELLKLVEHYLSHEKERNEITNSLSHFTKKNHTWDIRTSELLEQL